MFWHLYQVLMLNGKIKPCVPVYIFEKVNLILTKIKLKTNANNCVTMMTIVVQFRLNLVCIANFMVMNVSVNQLRNHL